jgi:hypothetical protein
VRDPVSWREYVTIATKFATAQALLRLARQRHDALLRGLPIDVVFEPLRAPLAHLTCPTDLFCLPDDDAFYVDLLTSKVTTGEELRSLCVQTLSSTSGGAVMWCLTETHGMEGIGEREGPPPPPPVETGGNELLPVGA